MKTKYSIVEAPSKFKFFNEYPVKINGHRSVMTFKVKDDQSGHIGSIFLVVNSHSWEDGSGESWCIDGYVYDMSWLKNGEARGLFFRGYFRTDRKDCGWIEVDSDRNSHASV